MQGRWREATRNMEQEKLVIGLMETPTCLDGDAVLKIVMGIIMTVMGR